MKAVACADAMNAAAFMCSSPQAVNKGTVRHYASPGYGATRLPVLSASSSILHARRKPPEHENTRNQRRARDLNPCALARSPFSRRAPSANSVSPPCLRPRTRSAHGALLRFRPEALPRTSRPVDARYCTVPARGFEPTHGGATPVAHATTFNRLERNATSSGTARDSKEPPISGSALELVVELQEAPRTSKLVLRSERDLNPRYR